MLRIVPWFLWRWPRASARIARYWIKRDEGKPNGQRFYHPVVKFKTSDGRCIVAISSWGSWRKPWPVGHPVLIRYCPEHPQQIEVECFSNMWGLPLTILAIVLFIICMPIMWRFTQHWLGLSPQ